MRRLQMRTPARAMVLLAALTALIHFGPTDVFACGKERWKVKTGGDVDAKQVDLAHIHKTRISAMRSWPAPNHLPASTRIAPQELQVWSVDGTIKQYKKEDDDDIHLVLTDDSGHTMIAEIPDPNCVDASSPFLEEITATRKAFEAAHPVTKEFQPLNIRARVVGVGFFDFQHGQTGVAPNGIELHPVLEIIPLGPKPAPKPH
jgi:hypothetical protein